MKKLLLGLAALVVLVIVAALVAPFLIPTDTYTTRLVSAVKSATGRDLKIAGAVKLSLLPRLELDASDVSFANAPGAHDPDMAKLKELEVTLRVLPLLSGRVELGRFVLDEPQISLEVAKDGRPNWVFASPSGAAPAAPPQAAPSPSQPAPAAPPSSSSGFTGLSGLSLGDVRLNNGSITYRDDRTDKVEAVSEINMSLSLPDLDSPFAGQGSAVWNGQKISLDVGAAKPGALLSGGQSAFNIKLSGAPLALAFDGSVDGLPPKTLGGTIDLSVPSLRDLATWVGSPLPPGQGFQKLAIKGQINEGGGKFAFSNADIAFDAITAKGSVSVATGGPRPDLTGSLAVDTLDLNPYLPAQQAGGAASGGSGTAGAAGSSGGAGSAAPAQQGWSDAPIDLSPLHLADGHFALTANAIRYKKIEVGPSALDLQLKDAKLVADLSRLKLYKGQGQGKVSVDGGRATPAIGLDFALKGVDIGPLLQAAAGTDRLDGTGNINFTTTGSGASQRAIVSSLNGNGALALTNGELKGVNLIALAENTASSVTGGNGVNNSTSFGSLTGTFTMTNGIIHNNDLQMKSGVIPITGAGTVNLPSRSVNYRVTVSLAGAIGVPVLVTGPWDNLSYRPDLAGMAQGLVKTPGNVINQLGGAGAKGVGGASGLIQNLFGK